MTPETGQDVALAGRNELTDFGVTDDALRELVKKYETFPDPAAGPDEYLAVVAGVKEIRNLRGDIERSRKMKKADIVRDGKIIDTEANRIKDILFGIENPMKDAKVEVDNEKERIEAERVAAIVGKIAELTVTNVEYGMSLETIEQTLEYIKALPIDESFAEFYHDAEQAKQKSLSVLTQALKSAQDRADQEKQLEEQRVAQRAEQKRLDTEREERAAEQALADDALAEDNRKLREETDRIAAERRQLDQEKEDAEALAQAKAETEAEIKRLAELEPDKKKLKALAKAIERHTLPALKSAAAQTIVADTQIKLAGIALYIRSRIQDIE